MECMEIALEILSNRSIASSLSANPTLTELILLSVYPSATECNNTILKMTTNRVL